LKSKAFKAFYFCQHLVTLAKTLVNPNLIYHRVAPARFLRKIFPFKLITCGDFITLYSLNQNS
jgi:hypothetical protein